MLIRFITTEELEQALHEYNIHDGRDIKEILQEVDVDNVSAIINLIICILMVLIEVNFWGYVYG